MTWEKRLINQNRLAGKIGQFMHENHMMDNGLDAILALFITIEHTVASIEGIRDKELNFVIDDIQSMAKQLSEHMEKYRK